MQKNDLVLKRRAIWDDSNEVPGLVESSDLKDEEGLVDVPSFNRMISVKNGVKKFEPQTFIYKVTRGTTTLKFFYDFFNLNEFHDLALINTDGVGIEVDRWLLRDCECSSFNERTYNAGGGRVLWSSCNHKLFDSTRPQRGIA